jgi:hypothetical protein
LLLSSGKLQSLLHVALAESSLQPRALSQSYRDLEKNPGVSNSAVEELRKGDHGWFISRMELGTLMDLFR